jgi:hypothetical protein
MHEVDTHSRSPDLADDRSRAFSIVLIGNQIADYLLFLDAVGAAGRHADDPVLWRQ